MHRPHQGIEPESQSQALVHSLAPATTSHPAAVSKHSLLCRCEAAMTAFKGIWTQQFWRAVCGEFLATLIFVLLGTGSTIGCDGKSGPLNIVLISLCFGLSIATMVQCFSHISGGHVNPVVTVAMVCTQKLSLAKGFFYICGQCLGAIVGAGILYLITPPDVAGGLGATMVYWVGPMMGGVIAAVLYEYLFCPDKEPKHQFNRSQAIEYEDLVVKPGSSEVMDIDESEEKKGKDTTKELLSSV
ncbi:hypothetical protein scyTo_0019710 [Scyliorhinus torazame]|uniref:Aquaporin-4 n=1 Tax=Scyliorhinus torazame TaxID=75743 RepID=A0A401PPF5_SCYTO|nr:hypothetical protein [Scyliorhinus torazame]